MSPNAANRKAANNIPWSRRGGDYRLRGLAGQPASSISPTQVHRGDSGEGSTDVKSLRGSHFTRTGCSYDSTPGNYTDRKPAL